MANVSRFSTEQVFRSHEDLMTWVQNVARSQGYVIVTKRSKAITFGKISKVVLGCDRGGVARSNDAETKKINCPFELVGKYLKAHDVWTLRVVRDEHNHEPTMCMEGHPYAMRLSDKETNLVQNLTKLNVKPKDILSTLKEQNQNNVSSMTTIYNVRHKFRISEREGRTPMQNVMHILQTKGYGVEYRLNNVTNKLEDLFFVHPTSLKMWQAFPHVVLLDATYKTNKYNLPFLEIVGVTSTNKTFSIAFAFMGSEKTGNYRWALTCLKMTINESFCPRVIVTDRDLALMKKTFHTIDVFEKDFPYHRAITISHVYGNHYVMVQLEGEYPMPPIAALWIRHKGPLATGWETMYKSSLDFYKHLKPTQRDFISL